MTRVVLPKPFGTGNDSSLVSLMAPCIAGVMSPLWTVDLATTTMLTPRLTRQHQMTTTTSPPSPVNRSHPCSHQHFKCLVLLPHSLVSWGQSTTSSTPTHQQLGSKSSSSAFSCGASSNSSSRNARSSRWFLLACLLGVLKILLKRSFGTSPLPWTSDPVMWEPGSSPVRSGSVSKRPECA